MLYLAKESHMCGDDMFLQESMLQRPPVMPVNMKDYEPMLCKMASGYRITMADGEPQSFKSYA